MKISCMGGKMPRSYCIVLHWRDGHCCPMHCDLFQIYCAPPNLDITRTWICRLNFAQRPIFSDLRFFNEPEISDSGGLGLRILTSWNIHRPQPGLNPRTLDLEASTYTRHTHYNPFLIRNSSFITLFNLITIGRRLGSRVLEHPVATSCALCAGAGKGVKRCTSYANSR